MSRDGPRPLLVIKLLNSVRLCGTKVSSSGLLRFLVCALLHTCLTIALLRFNGCTCLQTVMRSFSHQRTFWTAEATELLCEFSSIGSDLRNMGDYFQQSCTAAKFVLLFLASQPPPMMDMPTKFGARDLALLAPHVSFFSLMTYDFSTAARCEGRLTA
jgi:hypothetical protein